VATQGAESAVYVRLRNDLYCVEWGVKLYSIHPSAVYDCFVYVCGWHYRRENQLEVDGKQVDEECFRLSSNVSTSSQVK